MLYFVKTNGLKLLRDSFDHGIECMTILEKVLRNEKVWEEFHKIAGYEKLIDYLVS